MVHLGRIEQSDEVEEVDRETFDNAVREFLARRGERGKTDR
jgi:hypothetical protein